MVGLFSRFSGGRTRHRRSQSAIDEREVIQPTQEEVAGYATTVATHGIEVAVDFKPIEHPVEPLDNAQPIRCPLPEPSILNDGRIWKERLSANVQPDLPVIKRGSHLDPEGSTGTKPRIKRGVLPSSMSAPEHNIIAFLEECNATVD